MHPEISQENEQRKFQSPRRSNILAAAARAFAASGFKGAGLRDIATDAGVSLTLVHHYFGSKSNLLHAVVDNHHEICRERMVDLAALVIGDDGPIPLESLVSAWVRYEYDLYTSPAGEHYFLLMLKLANEVEVDLGAQRRLNCSEALVLRGFERSAPSTSATVRMKAFRSASAALHIGILDYGVSVDEGVDNAEEKAVAFSTVFILSGLSATLH